MSKIKTSDNLKKMICYYTDHFIISDGWFLYEMLNDQIQWINNLLK